MNEENTTRKKQIRTAAIDLIAEKGIQNVTMKNLSRLIGISEPAIYRYYNSKYDILYGILDSFEEYSIGKIKAIQKQMNHPLQQMEAFFMNRCQLCQGAPNVAKVVFSEEYFQHDERLAEKMSSIMHQHGTFSILPSRIARSRVFFVPISMQKLCFKSSLVPCVY
ncbi:MAG: TetR/AcrR family transcriptional regulator [Caldisericia bacterium]|nr:TetR/AcrR family transcriptional regulator [Caldisericia bacterium]